MDNKDSSYLKTSSFWSSSPHIGPTRNQTMTEGTSQRDQAGGMVREFKRGEIQAKSFFHLVTSLSSQWRRLEIAGSLQDWLEARRDFFPDPRIHHAIEAERQSALGEIAASMRRPPAPSSARLSTEAGDGFPAHGLAPDQPSPLRPTPNPVPGPVPEGFMDEPPPHPDPVPSPVPGGFIDEPPPHPDSVSGLVLEGFLDEPASTPRSCSWGPKSSRPHTLFLSVRGSWMDCLHFLLLFLVLSWRAPRTNCLHPWFPFRRSSWRTCLHFLFLSLRSARTHPLCMLGLGGSAADLHSLTEGPSGLCTDHLGSSGFRTVPLSFTVGSPGPAAGRQIIGSYVAGLLSSYVTGLLIACPYVAGLLIAGSTGDSLLIVGSAGDGHRASRLNSGSARDGLQASRLNSGSAGDGLRAGRLNSGSVGDGLWAGRLNSWFPLLFSFCI
ncbi:hypothetical protein CRENBAI_009575 [Crenichthys baileyi]|uniref:Uncharacterized protein n=1 Tax=Crenichthys baileyi TaxID=28760 RepID=A0AAV9RK52_9TELE